MQECQRSVPWSVRLRCVQCKRSVLLSALASNSVTHFERKLGWTPRAMVRGLRYWMLTDPGVVVRGTAHTLLHLAESPALRDWWRTLQEKITAPWASGNAVETRRGWAR